MRDSLGRCINYLRISVTDRCNLRCRYCMPDEGISKLDHSKILSFEEILRLVKICSGLGIKRVRITGGEPLVRSHITTLIEGIASTQGIDEVTMTTNGTLFAPLAQRLQDAGLTRVNFSLDSLDENKYHYITRQGRLEQVWRGIMTALESTLSPIKLNIVLIRGFNDDEILDFAELAYDYPLQVRFIEFMPVGDLLFWDRNRVITIAETKNILAQKYNLIPATATPGSGPAQNYVLEGGQGGLGFISPISSHFCAECNRIRLTAEGKMRSCLYDNNETDLKAALDRGASDEDLLRLVKETIAKKPDRHHMDTGWGASNHRKMYQIGG